jgi:hypothetical protein
MSRIGCLATLHHSFHKTNRRNLLSLVNKSLLVVGTKLQIIDDYSVIMLLKWYNRDYNAKIIMKYGQYICVKVGCVTVIIDYWHGSRKITYRFNYLNKKAEITFTNEYIEAPQGSYGQLFRPSRIQITIKRNNAMDDIYRGNPKKADPFVYKIYKELMQSSSPMLIMIKHIDELTKFLIDVYTKHDFDLDVLI